MRSTANTRTGDVAGPRCRTAVTRAGLAGGVLVLAACAGGTMADGAAGGAADPARAAQLTEATRPTERLHVLFDWSLTDRDARFTGRGVLRLDRDQRARVDLFGPRGETLAAAIAEGERMRIVPQAAESMLPPASMMWSLLGAFRQPAGAPLVATGTSGGRTVLEYGADGTRWRFQFTGDTLRHIEWTAAGGRRTVELTGSAAHDLPAQANFRDWTQFRELSLRVTDVETTSAFDADVWILPGER